MKKFLLSGVLTAMIFSVFAQTQVGRTRYDLQTNNSNCRRVAVDANDNLVVTYTRSHMSGPDYLDRGTGYNYSSDNGTTWATNSFTGAFNRPDTSRTGWPNIVYTNTKEVIISHFASGVATDPNGVQVLRRDIGSTGPYEKLILNSGNSTNPANNLYADDATWTRAAAKGDSIFVIFGMIDVDMPGMTGGMQMYRSIDAGATWEGPHDIPMMNSTNFVRNGGDNYALDMNDNGKIAIVLGTYQVEVLTSTDWGATFQKQTVVEVFELDGVTPAPLFDALSGETMDTVNTTDRSYSVVVDDNDMVHVWFGRTRSFKWEASTTGASYLPLSVGLVYWNDAMTEAKVVHESRLAAQQAALCNPLFSGQVFSSTSGFGDQLNLYRATLTSMPNGGYDDNGNIFVAYSAIVPATFDDVTDLATTNNIDVNGFHFRDIYVLKSSDNGATWVGPINISNAPLAECAFPGVPRKIYGSTIPVIWQQDSIPGTNLQEPDGVNHPTVENEILFSNVDMATIVAPADITCPTIAENTTGANTITTFLGCDADFGAAFNTDDVPEGPNVLDYQIVDASALVNPGTHAVDIYVEDMAGNSSDTLNAIVTVVADNIPPVVTLVGPASLDVLVNTSYTDPGITYTDNACYPSATPIETDNVNPNIATIGSYTYDYLVTDNSNNSTSISRTVNVIGTDTVAPVITLNGAMTDTVEACSNWTDLGFTAFDNVDFDVTANVTTTGAVNINVPGVYVITYNVTDAAGNSASVTRTITVEDTTAPDLVIDFNSSTMYVCKGGVFTAPSSTATDCVTTTNTLADNGSTMVDVNTSGTYTVTYTATDEANNVATKTLEVKVGEAPVPAFSYTKNDVQVTVTDESTNSPSTWDWNWGDGSAHKFTANAQHQYGLLGEKEICLIVTNNFTEACSVPDADRKICETVDITIGIEELNALNAAVDVFPNPSKGLVNVTISQENLTNVVIKVYNVIGEVVATKTIDNTSKNNTVNFNLGEDAAGVYVINIETEKATISKNVVVE